MRVGGSLIPTIHQRNLKIGIKVIDTLMAGRRIERPNPNCLYCDEVLDTNYNSNRAVFTCGGSCWLACNRSLNCFNPEINRRRGQSIFGLSMLWWILRNAKTPLTHNEIQNRLRKTFGDLVIFKKKLTNQSLKYIESEYYSVDKLHKAYTFTVADLPFNQVLKEKYLEVLRNA